MFFKYKSDINKENYQENKIIVDSSAQHWNISHKGPGDPFLYFVKLLGEHEIPRVLKVMHKAKIKLNFIKSNTHNNISHHSSTHNHTAHKMFDEILIWEDDRLKIVCPENPLVPHHIQIQLKTCYSLYSDVSDNDALKLERHASRITRILASEFGISDTVIAFSEKGNHTKSDHIAYDIIPPRPGSYDVLDNVDKIQSIQYLMFNHWSLPSPGVDISEKERHEIANKFKVALANNIPRRHQFHTSAPDYLWTQHQSNSAKAKRLLLDCFYHFLTMNGFIIDRYSNENEVEQEHLTTNSRQMQGDPFQDPLVLKKQKIISWNGMMLLYNYRSFGKAREFLIVPERSVIKAEELTDKERRARFEVIKAFQKSIEIYFNHENVKVHYMTQDGPSVGQTVPHTHIKVMVNPDINFLLYALEFNYNLAKTVSDDEMIDIKSTFQKLMQYHLSQKNTPHLS